ncbi:hypothetical protein ACFVWF_29515 [Rhodococcus qingshengii]|uniref:hypothetical protein n=1 Tax=Rhodococcus qingshengii TaxID=334542 RepID=UPI0036D89B70
MHNLDDWVSVADVLKVMGTSSFIEGRVDIESVLACVDTSGRLRLRRVHTEYEEMPKPIPIEALLDRTFGENSSSNSSTLMMELFIAEPG